MPTAAELHALVKRAAAVAADWAARSEADEVVAAAAILQTGRTPVGVWVEAAVDSACLCAETGPICEAHLTHDPIVAIACVSYLAGRPIEVLPACGVCQERLQAFGLEVLVAVSADPAIFKTLAELRPWPWWEERPTDGDTTWSARRR